MKRVLFVLMSLILCFPLFSCDSKPSESLSETAGLTEEREKTPLLAGFAERDFTPEKMGDYMPGSSFAAQAKRVNMPLLANAAAFESDGIPLILISLDILRLHEASCAKMKERIREKTSVPEGNILIVATHTHTGIGLMEKHNQNPGNPEAFRRMMDLAVEAATEAWESRSRGKIGYGTTELKGYSFCREAYMKNGDIKTWPSSSNIDRLIGEPDPSVNVIRVDDLQGQVRFFAVNWANHPDSSSKNGYHPDYPGVMRQKLKKEYGENVVILYLNGAEGDVNYIDYLNGAKSAGNNGTIGTALADAVIELNRSLEAREEYPVIGAVSRRFAAAQRVPSEADMQWARKTMEKISKGESVDNLTRKYATEYTTIDYSALGPTHEIEVQAVVLGEFAMAALPCEPYSELGWKIRESSPYENTFVVGLANGSHGYIGPDFIYGTSAYPARYSFYTSRFGIGTADLLIQGSVGLLKEIQEG